MSALLSKFFRGESGAVTVDWIVLTAAIVGFAVLVFAGMQNTLAKFQTGFSAAMSQQEMPAGE